ncbi:hypothetical protein V6N13_047067 [Hibiscus sabdariffa]
MSSYRMVWMIVWLGVRWMIMLGMNVDGWWQVCGAYISYVSNYGDKSPEPCGWANGIVILVIHRAARIRGIQNHLAGIQIKGVWVTDPEALHAHFFKSFRDHFAAVGGGVSCRHI